MEKTVLFLVKEGKWDKWKDWCHELATTLQSEALLTLEEEKVLQELAVGFMVDDKHYVLGFMEGDCLPANLERELNQRHQAMRAECLEKVSDGELLYNLKR